jgi:hypothetical protein
VRANLQGYWTTQPPPFTPAWYAHHPNAWKATHPYAPYAAATFVAAATWLGISALEPVVYEYGGTTVVYENGGAEAEERSSEADASAAQALAASGLSTDAAAKEWLPLGVFALARDGQDQADHLVQLLVSKDGAVGGNFFHLLSASEQPLSGAVDRPSQRVAFSVKSNPQLVYETTLGNLTLPRSVVMVHFGNGNDQRWTFVRMHQD